MLTLVGLVGTWELIARQVTTGSLPPPTAVAAELATRPELYAHHAGITLYEVLFAFVLAALLGFVTAILIVYSKLLQATVYPILVILQVVPKVAIAPLLVVWLGFGTAPKIVVGVLVAFFPVLVSTITGLRSPDRELLDLVRVLNGRWTQELMRVRIPSALPSIFGGLKIAMTLAVVGVVVGELVSGNEGLGYLIIAGNAQFQLDMSFAALSVLSVTGLALFALVAMAEHITVRWDDADIQLP